MAATPEVSQRAPQPAGTAPWVENRASSRWLPKVDVRELWEARSIGWLLAKRGVLLRYKQTFFGVAWAVLVPLLPVAVLALTLGHIAKPPSDGLPYGLFLVAGFAVWSYLSQAITSGAESLVEDPDLITNVYFPRLLVPLAAVASALVDFGVALCLVLVALVASGRSIGVELLLAPAVALWAVAVAVGASLWLAALRVRYRDVGYAHPFLLQAWFLLTPVFYASSALDGPRRALLALNPACGVVDAFRWSLLSAPAPPLVDALSAASTIALLVGGTVYFRRAESAFADRI